MIPLAIVIPYYKLSFFEETLLSLQKQTNQQFNVYIGDDASPEDTQEVLEKYKDSFPFQYKRFETNLGRISLVKQWERCLTMVQDEEWIMFLCDDDILGDNCIESFYENLDAINSCESTVVRFATQVIDDKGQPITEIYQHPKVEKAADFLIRKFKGGTRSSLSEYIFKKEMIDKIHFKDFPLAWYSDLLAVLEFSNWKQIFTINEAIVYFRLSGLNITSRKDDLTLKNVATFKFYYYLLSNCDIHFSNEGIEKLLDNVERTFLDNKKNVRHWIQLFILYVRFFQYKRFLKLSFKVKKSIR